MTNGWPPESDIVEWFPGQTPLPPGPLRHGQGLARHQLVEQFHRALAELGVKNYGGAEVWADNGGTGYTQESVTFTSGPNSTQATIYCSKPVNGNTADFDDLALSLTPTTSPVPDLATNSGTPPGVIPFTITRGTAAVWTVSVASDNPDLVPNAAITLGGSGGQHTVQITPAPGLVGTANITPTVTDPVWAAVPVPASRST